MTFRRLAAATLCAATLGAAAASHAQATYPTKPVTIIVPFGAGGSADVYARTLAQHLQERLGQPFVVENRPGAGAVIGTTYVANAAPDGYTLLMMSNTHTVNESLIKNKSYTLEGSFVPVAAVNDASLILVARPTLGAKTLEDLLTQARANPGKLNYASSGTGTPYHVAGELFNYMAKVDIMHIPYKSSGGARTDVLGGQVDFMFDAVTTMRDLVQNGRVVALATTGNTRSTVLPDVPTMAEAGLPGYTASIWLGLLAPKGTPDDIVQKLNKTVNEIIDTPAIREAWDKNGADPLVMTQPEFQRYLADDIAKWARIVEAANIKIE